MSARRIPALAVLATAVAVAGATTAGAVSTESPGDTRINAREGRFVEIPDRIPHAEGAYIDKRIIRQLGWISGHFEVFITEGFAGKLPNGRVVGCPKCHVTSSDHKIGLAVDVVPLAAGWDEHCNRKWRDVKALAKWAEPKQGEPLPPFRWVGWEGDANHGCGDHLHLSWSHDRDYRRFHPSDWVEVFKVP